MKVFCDTNVIIAAFLQNHPHHESARPILERVKTGKDTGFVAAQSLAEVYAVLTRLPGESRLAPAIAWQLLTENVLRDFVIVTLTGKEYADTLATASLGGVEGGRTYDALLLKAAAKSEAERTYTLNARDFQMLANESLRSKVTSP
jgi:toxin FitB